MSAPRHVFPGRMFVVSWLAAAGCSGGLCDPR